MAGPIPDPASGTRRWSRRSVVVGGVGVAAVVWTGCTPSDPAVRPPPGTSRSPAPGRSATPSALPPALGRDVAAERSLADGARTLAADDGLSGRRRALLRLMAQTHDERSTALVAPDPALRPAAGRAGAPTPTPTATSDPAPTRARLARAEEQLADRHRRTALAATGLDALLWGSMAVASTRFAAALTAADPPASREPAPHAPVALLSDAEARTALVEALHAAVYGYQLALGRLPGPGDRHDRAVSGLRSRRGLRDRLVAQLVAAGVEVPAAAPAYDPSPEVRDADDAGRLLRGLETRLLPYCGLWLAAAGRTPERRLAVDALAATAGRAVAWGAPLTAWPGWQD